jgi:hypothetical protein
MLKGYVAPQSLLPMLATVVSVFRRAPLLVLRIAISAKAQSAR